MSDELDEVDEWWWRDDLTGSDLATKIVLALLDDITDRRGFGFDAVDDDTQKEMIKTLVAITNRVIQEHADEQANP